VSPRTRQALTVAAAAVAVAAVGGIVAILGWLPDRLTGETPVAVATPGMRVAGTAPPESLSPGESIVTPEKTPAPSSPAATPPPRVESTPPPSPAPKAPHRRCRNCGTISSTAFHEREPQGARWEVRVRFDDGTRMSMRYPTDPGLKVGDRVQLSNGRLRKD
jgi:hypothetical protein